MSSTSTHRPHLLRTVAPVTAALVLVALGATPSSARQDPGTPIPRADHGGGCLLQRVGTQFVRCDDLTGNGVPAPAYIPQR